MHGTKSPKLENETRLKQTDIYVGQLIRLNYLRRYNRYVKSNIPRDFLGIVINRRTDDEWAWEVLIGDDVRILTFRGHYSEPIWRLRNLWDDQRWVHDVTAVYGEINHPKKEATDANR
jgi:hypothetical protein